MEQKDICDKDLIAIQKLQQAAGEADRVIPEPPDPSVDSEEEYFIRLCLEPWEDEGTKNQTGKFKYIYIFFLFFFSTKLDLLQIQIQTKYRE